MSIKKFLVALCLFLTLLCSAQALKIEAKALLAQHLIKAAWYKSLDTNTVVKPWSWADTFPVMRIEFANGQEHFVLQGLSGQALAFGPAHMTGSALPGQNKEIVIAAHRDTHFSSLRDVVIGETVIVEGRDAQQHYYRIISAKIVDTRKEQLILDNSQEVLRLITCYPFDAINPNGPLRYELLAIPGHHQIETDFQNSDLQTAL